MKQAVKRIESKNLLTMPASAIVLAIVLAIMLTFFPIRVFATHGFGAGLGRVVVNDEIFEIWGYVVGDGSVPAFRLRDIAYILNSTAVQFDVRELDDDRWDFWIIRGAPYTVIGEEIQTIPEGRHAVLGSYGFISDWSYGFDEDPFQVIVLGIDGVDYPATSVAIPIIRDIDDVYFPLQNLGNLLGFDVEFNWSDTEQANDIDYFHSITVEPHRAAYIPMQTPEFIQFLESLSGHWIDWRFHYESIIDENIVWPVEFSILPHGFSDLFSQPMPFSSGWGGWRSKTEWYSLSMYHLDNDFVELTVDPFARVRSHSSDFYGHPPEEAYHDIRRFSDHRIVIDISLSPINEMTYYIGDTAFTMVRFDYWRNSSRYYVEPAEGGGIRLSYLITSSWIFQHLSEAGRLYDLPTPSGTPPPRGEIVIYRSTLHNARGEEISRRRIQNERDRALFEFIDTTVEFDKVYYYTLVVEIEGRNEIELLFDSNRQIAVDINELLGAPPQPEFTFETVTTTNTVDNEETLDLPSIVEHIETDEILDISNTPQTMQNGFWIIVTVIILFGVGVWSGIRWKCR